MLAFVADFGCRPWRTSYLPASATLPLAAYLGTSSPPGEDINPNTGDWQSLVLVNREAYSMNGGVPDGLSPGGYDYITWLHELGHDLGLAHPHDDGGIVDDFSGRHIRF